MFGLLGRFARKCHLTTSSSSFLVFIVAVVVVQNRALNKAWLDRPREAYDAEAHSFVEGVIYKVSCKNFALTYDYRLGWLGSCIHSDPEEGEKRMY